MATVALSGSRPNSEHITVAVREERKVYTFKIAMSMALYACLFFVLAFCGPYVLPAITLFSDAPLTDRQIAASQLLLLSDTVWVAIPVFFLGASTVQLTGDASCCRCIRASGSECQSLVIRNRVASTPVPGGRPVGGLSEASESRLESSWAGG